MLRRPSKRFWGASVREGAEDAERTEIKHGGTEKRRSIEVPKIRKSSHKRSAPHSFRSAALWIDLPWDLSFEGGAGDQRPTSGLWPPFGYIKGAQTAETFTLDFSYVGRTTP